MSEILIKDIEQKMINSINHLVAEFSTIRTGRANPSLVDKLNVEYYSAFGRELEYYTGIVFSIELNNKEISRGGEYNNLMKTLGYKKQINAFGGAIDLNQLLN